MNRLSFVCGIVAAHMAVAAHVRGEIGVNESTGALLVDGASTAFLSTVGTGNPRWAGYDLGEFDLAAGDTLALTNFYFENYAYNGGAIPPGGQYDNNWLDNDSTAIFTLFRDGVQLYQSALRQSAVNGNNRNWDLAASGVSVDILAGLTAPASHNLSWTIDWSYNQWSGSEVVPGSTQATSEGLATFAVVPEPSNLALLATGAAVALRFSRRPAAKRQPGASQPGTIPLSGVRQFAPPRGPRWSDSLHPLPFEWSDSLHSKL
jgi:hypothetical protein